MIKNSLLALFLVLGVLFIGYSLRPKKKAIDWSPNFNSQEKSPFGSYIFYQQLSSLFPGSEIKPTNEPIYNVLKENRQTGALLFLVRHSRYGATEITQTDIDQILRFVKQGNSVFIASNNLEKAFKKSLGIEIDYNYEEKSKYEGIQLRDSVLWGKNHYPVDTTHSDFSPYLNLEPKTKAEILGTNFQKDTNFVEFKLGKGLILIHSNPEIFSNLFLLEKNNAQYLSSALSYINIPVHYVYWDEYYHKDHPNLTPLQYILSQPNLKIGAICILLLFFIFATVQIKRRQRIIPIIPPTTNKTLEFIETLGLLYFEKGDHKNLFEKILGQFREFLKIRFFIHPKEFNLENIPMIKAKTGREEAEIKQLIHSIGILENQELLSDIDLLQFNELIQKFYI